MPFGANSFKIKGTALAPKTENRYIRVALLVE
jgi:hypothetical protein